MRDLRDTARLGAAFFLCTALWACASTAPDKAALAPEPAKPIDAARLYQGRWYEIERTPMSLTKNCVAGTTDYFRDTRGVLIDRDACRMDTPQGKEKTFSGPVTILNSGQNNKVRVGYNVFGLFEATRTYWMLDHGDDYDWFIVSDPAFRNLSFFTRDPRPSAELTGRLEARVRQLGYDTSKLERPSEFPAGMH